MSPSPYIDELRLTAFKSFREAVLPLRELTLLIGRNGSGKSNAIDALHVLDGLAEGEGIREVLDGARRVGSEVRGGATGCAPWGSDRFEIGCTIVTGNSRLKLDLTVQVRPEVRIVGERLVGCGSRGGSERQYLVSDPPAPNLSDIGGRYYNGKRGVNPAIPFRSDRLLTAQIATRVPAGSKATREVHDAAEAVLGALQGIFVLDPVPHLMRQYVQERDVSLRRQADNLSAVIGALQKDPERWQRLKELVRALPEQDVPNIVVEPSPLGDVMLALIERFDDTEQRVSARAMSDGMLRFLAFLAALLEPPVLNGTAASVAAHTLLVIEELENGLHPTQAARAIEVIKVESNHRRVRTLATTHSPAMLSALDASDHAGVVICRRDPRTAVSQLVPLVDLAGYPNAMAAGSLGDAVTQGRLDEVPDPAARMAALDKLLALV